MSAYLLGLGFKAEMGSQIRKLVLLKLIDACEDDGSRIYPAVETIARAAECSERQVQRELKAMVAAGLLRVVREGGRGPGSTREYAMDLAMLRAIGECGYAAVTGAPPQPEDGPEQPRSGVANGPANKGDTQSPLGPKGDTDAPLRVTGATEKGDTRSHPTPPDTPPLDPSIEREARASGPEQARSAVANGPGKEQGRPETKPPEPKPEDDPDFAALLKAFPGVDVPSRAYRAWLALPEAERKRALERVPAYLAQRPGRKAHHALSTYLGEKLFDQVPDPAAKPPATAMLPPRSGAWWAAFWRRRARGEKVSVMVEMAAGNTGYPVPLADVPDASSVDALAKVERGSPAFRALLGRLAREGVRIGDGACGAWIWAPPDLLERAPEGGRVPSVEDEIAARTWR